MEKERKIISLLALIVTIVSLSVAFAAMSGTFIGGVGDFVSLFDVNATKKDDYSSFFFS